MERKVIENLELRNQIIIDSVIKKAKKVCPESLALIGIYGSFLTGDIHEKSDLDLLIVINDDSGWQLGSVFLCEGVAHDIYCTSWETLENDSKYTQPNISKLMESKIVYVADKKYMERLLKLRENTNRLLEKEFSIEDFEKAEKLLNKALEEYAKLNISDDLSECRFCAGNMIYEVEMSLCMLNKRYFKLGVKRTYEELNSMKMIPLNLVELIDNVVKSNTIEEIRTSSTNLMKNIKTHYVNCKEKLIFKEFPTADNLCGSYEEIYSNWRNKMYHAAEKNDAHLAFMTMNSLQELFNEFYSYYKIEYYDIMKGYNSKDLYATAKYFDKVIETYKKEYEKVNLTIKEYESIEEFKKNY